MFKCKGTSFLRVALVAKVRNRISIYHLGPRPAVGCVAVGTFNFTLPDGMVRLPVQQAPYIFVTCQTEVGLASLQVCAGSGVDGVAVRTGDIVPLVSP